MQARKRHLVHGGSELDAPTYTYFDKLQFMEDFSIKKEHFIEPTRGEEMIEPSLSPENLIYEDVRENGTTSYTNYTELFLENVKSFPILYDENAEMRKYRSREAWKKISDNLGGRFTVGKLRLYWTTLMKKFKLYLSGGHYGDVENESLFGQLSFAVVDVQMKDVHRHENSPPSQFLLIEDENSVEEEHLLCEEVEESLTTSIDEQTETHDEFDDEAARAVEAIEEIVEPSPKKIKLETTNDCQLVRITKPIVITNLQPFVAQNIQHPAKEKTPPPTLPLTQPSTPLPTNASNEDEFDYFGKKVAVQLRELAQKSRTAARKGEIKVLQLLMELEESLGN